LGGDVVELVHAALRIDEDAGGLDAIEDELADDAEEETDHDLLHEQGDEEHGGKRGGGGLGEVREDEGGDHGGEADANAGRDGLAAEEGGQHDGRKETGKDEAEEEEIGFEIDADAGDGEDALGCGDQIHLLDEGDGFEDDRGEADHLPEHPRAGEGEGSEDGD